MSRLEVFAAWMIVTGTVFEAASVTPKFPLTDEQRESLETVGVALQAAGDTIIYELIEEYNLEKLGTGLFAIGNLTILQGLLRDIDDEQMTRFDMQGNAIQALGGSIILPDLLPLEKSKAEILEFYGLTIEVIGNVLHVFAGAKNLRGEDGDGDTLDLFGAWAQVLGSTMGAVGLEISLAEEDMSERDQEANLSQQFEEMKVRLAAK
ncbi:hypothetical protein [Geomicrobium sp. JCM 19038]|uniref:DUF6944 family repetitive protein n=1 Tax=Geomicrobium sp. JCM 19038 TaxID=1460635 RepID=UPI00045F38CF|nr:hypothetical protein [Geomicrobium sp. JCM 19038]GAK08581.1 hypothetical protein JCM19038_2367 [Geomicrobium sp. JCM 19038]